MSAATYRKIATHQTDEQPSWSVAERDPLVWIEQDLRPLLAELPVRIERLSASLYQDGATAGAEPRVRAIADIRIGTDGSYQDHCGFYLYWIDPDRHPAIAPNEIGRRWRYPSRSPRECRYLAAPENLVSLVRELHRCHAEHIFRTQKREKVRNLQRQAIIGQLRQLANEEQFAFSVENTARLLKISIRLDTHQQVRLSVPFSAFEQVLPQLRDMVLNLRALHQRKVRVKTMQIQGYTSWIEPEPPCGNLIAHDPTDRSTHGDSP
jgi:hypothetical protein